MAVKYKFERLRSTENNGVAKNDAQALQTSDSSNVVDVKDPRNSDATVPPQTVDKVEQPFLAEGTENHPFLSADTSDVVQLPSYTAV